MGGQVCVFEREGVGMCMCERMYFCLCVGVSVISDCMFMCM